MDTGSVRHWPRMPEEQLARVIAKGPLNSRHASDNSSGRPVAVAQAAPTRAPAFLAKLFGGGKDEEDHAETPRAGAAKPTAVAGPRSRRQTADKPAEKAAKSQKPAEKLAAVPVPQSRPAPAKTESAKTESFQLASATSKPAPARDLPGRVRDVETVGASSPTPQEAPAAPVQPATFQVASAASQPVRPAQAASLVARADDGTTSANDIIKRARLLAGTAERGAAEAPQTGAAARRQLQRAAAPARSRSRAPIRRTTASVAPWPLAEGKDSDRPTTPPNALAYAAQPTPIAQARPAPPMGSGNAAAGRRAAADQRRGQAQRRPAGGRAAAAAAGARRASRARSAIASTILGCAP